MQLFVSLHDHEDVRHSEFVFIFNAKTTLNRLVECIAVRFNIPLLHLKLFTTGGEIIRFHLNWKLSQMNLNHLDNVIVKHDKLVNWVQFLSSLETVKNAKNSRLIKWELDSASQQLPVLVNSKFFLAYVKFDSTPRMFFEEFGNCLYLNSEFKTIEIASKHYFSIILKDNPACPNLQFKCVNKRRARLGLQGGLECHIYEQGQLAKIYHVKIHTKKGTIARQHKL
ncbi:unnamed protein product [Caenorhabditis angaria]|uniref:Uncharacterized protein n=1 Tax=Caenorhabditis angaria TaxID=860376 RepID=A0A9P1IJM0_9PELO|nr:unnamed protein product [Caenorhabditis angaria]